VSETMCPELVEMCPELVEGDEVLHYAGSARIRARRSCPAIRAPDRQLGRTW